MKKLLLAAAAFAVCAGSPSALVAAQERSSAAALKQDMRKLWTDHVIWTRDYVVAALADAPGAEAAAGRLMKNQEEIGSAIGRVYGAPAGAELTRLLKEHITIAVDVVRAAKAGDKAGLGAADGRWQQNGTAIAAFLSQANPHLPQAAVADMMKKHLSTTTAEVVARLNKDWPGDVRAFDEVYTHMLMMSDAIADAVVKQFPDKFTR
jgi:hypothetical protein